MEHITKDTVAELLASRRLNLSEILGGTKLGGFKPCKISIDGLRITLYLFEDESYRAEPVIPGEHHKADWLIANNDGRLVGMQFWRDDL